MNKSKNMISEEQKREEEWRAYCNQTDTSQAAQVPSRKIGPVHTC